MFCNTSSAETGQGVVGVEAERSEGNIRVHLCTMDYVGRAAILGAHGGGGGWMHEYALEYVGMLYGSGEERAVEGILAEGEALVDIRYGMYRYASCVIWGMICLVRFIMVTSVVTGVELLGYVSTVVKIGKLFSADPHTNLYGMGETRGLHLF